MAANLDDVGIQSSALSLIESVDYTKKLDEAVITDSDSSFGDAEAFNPIIDFSIKGRGSIPALLLIGSDGSTDAVLTGINDGTGTIIITSVKTSESATDFDAWEIGATYYPNAVAA